MEQNYKALWFGVEDGDPLGRLAFWQCPEDCIPEEYNSHLGSPITLIPKFLVMKAGEVKKVIDGARLNLIQDQMKFHMPEGEE